VVDKLNLALVDFSGEEFQELLRLLVKLNTRLQSTLDEKALDEKASVVGKSGAGTATGTES
jgi:hypothetical protein